MPQPASITNASTQKIDTLYMPDGTPRVKVGIGTYAGAGDDEDGAGQLVGTHEATGAALGATDAIAVVAGVNDSALDGPTGDDIVPFLVDAFGRVILGGPTDDEAFDIAAHKLVPIALLADETSTDSVSEGDLGIPRITLDRKSIVTPYVHAGAGGWTPYQLISAASTNATSVKASAGKIGHIFANNVDGAAVYLKIYDKAAAPTVGTDVPKHTLMIPAGGIIDLNFGDAGLQFLLGIAIALTVLPTVADTTDVDADETVVNLAYL